MKKKLLNVFLILFILTVSIKAVIITKVGYNTTLQFSNKVNKYIVGNQKYFKSVEKNSNFIFLNPKYSDYQTNITVILKNGTVKDLIIRGIKAEIKRRRKYNINKQINYKRLYNFSEKKKQKKSIDLKKNNKNSKKSENKYKKNKNYKIYKYKKFLKKYGNQLNESKYSIVKSSIYLTAMEVIRENNLIYITIRIKNESSNEYQILNSKNNPELYLRKYNYGLLKLSKNTTSNIPVKDKIVAVLLPDKHRINSGNKGYIIYVIKQFGISSNNFIRAEIIEKNGNRDITIEAKWESLN